MTRKEKKLLREAGEIIKREILADRDVRIPGFGVFWRNYLHVWPEMWSEGGPVGRHIQCQLRFRPYPSTKNLVMRRKKACPKKTRWSWCCHRDGKGHDGPCADSQQRPIPERGV